MGESDRSRILSALSYSWLIAVVLALGAVAWLWLTGASLASVESDSMGPTLPRNSLALIESAAPRSIRVDDVVRFRDPRNGHQVLHRVVEVVSKPMLGFRTQGDANRSPDSMIVPAASISGRMEGSVAHLGTPARVLGSGLGAVLLAAVPLCLLGLGAIKRRWDARTGTPAPAEV